MAAVAASPLAADPARGAPRGDVGDAPAASGDVALRGWGRRPGVAAAEAGRLEVG